MNSFIPIVVSAQLLSDEVSIFNATARNVPASVKLSEDPIATKLPRQVNGLEATTGQSPRYTTD